MKIGCISWSYRKEFTNGKYDLISWLRHCSSEAMIDGVELWNNHFNSLDDNYLDHISSFCKSEGLDLYSVATKCDFGNFSEIDVENAMITLREWLAVADRLGVTTLRVSISGVYDHEPDRQNKVFENITKVINENKYPLIIVGIENKEPSVVQNSGDVKLMDKISKSKLKLILDNGSFIDKETIYDFMEETLPYAALVHAKFFEIDQDGADKVLDYRRIIPIIRRSGYDGFLSIEYDSEQLASRDVPLIAKYLRKMVQD